MASLDLKDAYYSVAVNPLHRKYLRFIWKNVLCQFTCLLNELSSCPRKFTKLLKPPLTELHKKGHISASYIDDLYLQGKTYDLCVSNVIDTFIQFDSLGFTIHPEKICICSVPTFGLIRLCYRFGRHDHLSHPREGLKSSRSLRKPPRQRFYDNPRSSLCDVEDYIIFPRGHARATLL